MRHDTAQPHEATARAVRPGEGKEHGNEWKNRPDQRADQRGSGFAHRQRPSQERKLDQAMGKVKDAAEKVVDKVKKTAEKAVDKVKDA
jgi:hypothetical protein